MENSELAAKRALLDAMSIEQVAAWLDGLSHAEYLDNKELADEQYNNPRISVFLRKKHYKTDAERNSENVETVRKYFSTRFGLDI